MLKRGLPQPFTPALQWGLTLLTAVSLGSSLSNRLHVRLIAPSSGNASQNRQIPITPVAGAFSDPEDTQRSSVPTEVFFCESQVLT